MTGTESRIPGALLPATCIVGRQALAELLQFAAASLGGGLDEIAARLAVEVESGQRVSLYDPEWQQLMETTR